MAVPYIHDFIDPKIRAAISLLRAHGHDVLEGSLIYKIDGHFRTRREVFSMAHFPEDDDIQPGTISGPAHITQ